MSANVVNKLPTYEQAIQHVQKQQYMWEIDDKSFAVLNIRSVFDNGVLVIRIETNMAIWFVWFDEDGEVYGEC